MAEIIGKEVILKDENGEVIVPYVGYASSGRNVGDIFYTSRLDTELNGAVECNGATYDTGDFSGKQSIGELLSGGSLPYVSLSEYANLVSANGSCRAFGWDGGTSFRVPTIPALLLTKEQASVVGNDMTLGLTNGTTNVGLSTWYANGVAALGQSESGYGKDVGTTGQNISPYQQSVLYGVTTDPTKSGIVANLDTIQYRAMVQLAIKTTDDAVITVTSGLQQIANKVDKTSATDRETVVGWGMPDYSAVISGVGNNYIAPFDGVYWFACATLNKEVSVYIDNIAFERVINAYGANGGYHIPLEKGQKIHIGENATTASTLNRSYFMPYKGVN